MAATVCALKTADVVVTEAGFGADLGAEKFLDIKCRIGGLKPSAIVLVATVRALKYNGGVKRDQLGTENLEALAAGFVNLQKHIENLQLYDVPVVVTLNAFVSDTEAETKFIEDKVRAMGCEFALARVWEKGGEGGEELAKAVLKTLEEKESHYHPLYPDDMPLDKKIETIATKIYGADGVIYGAGVKTRLKKFAEMGFGNCPVCIAKTQYSLSDNQKKLGRPTGYKITIREVNISAGAGFVVAIAGDIMTMPGLPPVPAAENIDIDENGVITGLF